jgi:hypothetical protein
MKKTVKMCQFYSDSFFLQPTVLRFLRKLSKCGNKTVVICITRLLFSKQNIIIAIIFVKILSDREFIFLPLAT